MTSATSAFRRKPLRFPAFSLSSTEPALPPARLRLRPHDRHRPKFLEYGPEFLQRDVLHLDQRRGMVQAMESQLEQQRFEAARLRIFLCTPFPTPAPNTLSFIIARRQPTSLD